MKLKEKQYTQCKCTCIDVKFVKIEVDLLCQGFYMKTVVPKFDFYIHVVFNQWLVFINQK